MSYLLTVVTFAVIYSIACLALNVRWGWSGQFDFFVYGLVALGAYVDAVTTLPPQPKNNPGLTYILGLRFPFLAGALSAMCVTSVVSLVVGAIALRQLRQIYFGIMTFASVLIMAAIVENAAFLFNGYTGVYGVPQPFAGVLNLSNNNYQWFFLAFCFAILGLVYWVLQRIFWSPAGLGLRAIREDEVAAAAFGYNPYAERLKAYVIGGAIAGLAGALLISYITAFNVDTWSPIETVLIFAAIIVGGSGNNLGVIIGSFLIFGAITQGTQFLPTIPSLENQIGAIRAICIGLLTLAFLRWRPQGVLPERHFSAAGGALKSSEPAVPIVNMPDHAAVTGGLLAVTSVSKRFGGTVAVDDMSMTVQDRCVTGLIGPNGAGKSTLIELLSGTLAPDSGRVIFDGREIQDLPSYARSRLGLLRTFQLAREWPGLTVLENVMVAALGSRRQGFGRAVLRPSRARADNGAATERALSALQEFGLLPLQDELAGRLSGGQKRLLEFARLIVCQPRVVLLDEPFAGVNPLMAEAVQEGIQRLIARGTAVVLIEHNLDIVERLCDNIVVMALGHPIAEGTMGDLRSNSTVVEAYLGA